MHYDIPSGHVGRRFVLAYANQLQHVINSKHSAEKAILFPPCILQTMQGVHSAHDIRDLLDQQMDLWEEGKFSALVNGVLQELDKCNSNMKATPSDARCFRAYNTHILSGRLQSATRQLTKRTSDGGTLGPNDKCTKTGWPVLVLWEKHPPLCDTSIHPDTLRRYNIPAPPSTDPLSTAPHSTDTLPTSDAIPPDNHTAFDPYEQPADPSPLKVTSNLILHIVRQLTSAAGPSRTDATSLAAWCIRFGTASDTLRNTIMDLTNLLANTSPLWAYCRVLMVCCLVTLDKCPGIRPMGIGESLRRLMAKLVLATTGHQATAACGIDNLCAGLPAGIEGSVHTLQLVAALLNSTPFDLLTYQQHVSNVRSQATRECKTTQHNAHQQYIKTLLDYQQ